MLKKLDKFLSNLTCKIIGHSWVEIDFRGKKMCKVCYEMKGKEELPPCPKHKDRLRSQ